MYVSIKSSCRFHGFSDYYSHPCYGTLVDFDIIHPSKTFYSFFDVAQFEGCKKADFSLCGKILILSVRLCQGPPIVGMFLFEANVFLHHSVK